MKKELRGFVEGATNITTGDRMKKDDHRRDKRRCKHYVDNHCLLLSRKCTGSSQCKYYNDGIKVVLIDEPVPHFNTNEKRLYEFVYSLRNKICHKSLEGKLIIRMIRKKYRVNSRSIEMAESQIKQFEKEKKILQNEVLTYNESLKSKCIFMSLFIFTIPFCYLYYKNNHRSLESELRILKDRIIDTELQKAVVNCKSEVEQYMIESETAQRKYTVSDKDIFYSQAKYSYENGEHENFCFYIIKSIQGYNQKAMMFLANVLQKGDFIKKDNEAALILLAYSSYLGNKISSGMIANELLSITPKSKLGNKFYEKSVCVKK